MSDKSSEMPREWYIIVDGDTGEGWAYLHECASKHPMEIHVIEYKSYQELKTREQKLLEVIKVQNETLHYFASEFTSAREALAKVEGMMREIGVGK